MNKKMLGICLAAAVISTGTLGGVVASEVADRSLLGAKAEIDTEATTYGNIRFWFSSDPEAPFGDAYFPKIWFHNDSGMSFASELKNTHSVMNSAENNRKYWYVDVPYVDGLENATGTIQVFHSNDVWNNNSSSFAVSDLINKVIYVHKVWDDAGVDVCGRTDVNVAALALEGLYTCSGSSLNGYNAIETFSETWIWKDYDLRDTGGSENWRTSGMLNAVSCQDYAFGADWKDSSTSRDTSINAQTKLDTLVAMHEMYAA